MTGRLGAVVVNAVDPPALARFWSEVLDAPVTESGPDWAQLAGAGSLAFQSDPAPKQAPNRLHLDVLVDDLGAATAAVVAGGARPLSEIQGEDNPWQVFADPEGNEFCLLTR